MQIKKIKMDKIKSILSPLEQDVLQYLWPDRTMRVREIYEYLKPKRKVALSSIAVILDRLHEKGIVERKVETARGGLRYIYYPKQDKNEFEKSVIEKAVNGLIESFGASAVSYFNERFSK